MLRAWRKKYLRLYARIPQLAVQIGECHGRAPRGSYGLVFVGYELVLAYTADGANPIIWNVFKGCARGDATIGITHFGVVDIAARLAKILLHGCIAFKLLVYAEMNVESPATATPYLHCKVGNLFPILQTFRPKKIEEMSSAMIFAINLRFWITKTGL